MDFVHNPYRCGPLKVGMYAIVPLFLLTGVFSVDRFNYRIC